MRRGTLRRYAADRRAIDTHVSRMWPDPQFDRAADTEGRTMRRRRSSCMRLRSVGAVRDEQSTAILSWLRPHLRPAARMLDVGCGFGSFLKRARDMGCAVRGIEPDPDACAGACQLLGEGVVEQGTLQHVNVPAGSADVVASLDVLEHVPPEEHAAFARAIAHVLARGGLWVIKIPIPEGLYL